MHACHGKLLCLTLPAPALMNKSHKFQLFLMMALEIAIWGAWQVQIFNYMRCFKFEGWQQNLAGSMFAIASVVGIFFSNQFADRNFSAEKFLAFSHLIGGLALVGAGIRKGIHAVLSLFSALRTFLCADNFCDEFACLRPPQRPGQGFRFYSHGRDCGLDVVSWPLIFCSARSPRLNRLRWIFLVAAFISLRACDLLSHVAAHAAAPKRRGPRQTCVAQSDEVAGRSIRAGAVHRDIDRCRQFTMATLFSSADFLKMRIHMPDNWIAAVTPSARSRKL